MRTPLFALPGRLLVATLLCAAMGLAMSPGQAFAGARPRPQMGSLVGFPRIRGVIPVLGSEAAITAHAKSIEGAFDRAQAARVRRDAGAPVPSPEIPGLGCPEAFLFTQDVCYQGGPVLRDPVVHLIFWLGPNTAGVPSTAKVSAFPEGYERTVEEYFEDVSHDSGLQSNVFSVDPQYGDTEGPGEYASRFFREAVGAEEDESAGVAEDADPFPLRTSTECPDFTEVSEGPCVLDEDIRQEVASVAKAHDWKSESLGDVFFVFTPPGVGSCEQNACAYEAYCAYHGDFGGSGEYLPPGNETIYANMPFPVAGSGCTSGVHPNATTDNGADAAIDNASHEFNEAITDPLGSQCNAAETVCEPFSWTDAIGQEIADKCLPPETTIAGVYGEPLGGETVANVFNQLINGDHYFTQRVWSNAAGLGEGECVQRIVRTSFLQSGHAEATRPAEFNGSGSGSSGDPVSFWEWNFGDGTIVASPQPTVAHVYAKAGEYSVTLTAFDIYGNANTVTHSVDVSPSGSAPGPSPPSVETLTSTVTTTTTTTATTSSPEVPLKHLSARRLAGQLGVPGQGAKLSGAGKIKLGNAQCPPACGVSVKLFFKKVLVGAAKLKIKAKGAKAIVVKLGARGRALLREDHRLKVALKLTVEDPQGAKWQLVSALTLTSSG